MIEKYPNVLAWVPPRQQSNQVLYRWPGGPSWQAGTWPVKGVVKCEHCHLIGVHDLAWPRDAYYQWEIRGHTLWAWSSEHAVVLRDYIGSDDRDASRYGEYAHALRHLPKEFLTAKVRSEAVKRISQSL